MKKFRSFVILIVVLLVFGLTACKRDAPAPEVTTPPDVAQDVSPEPGATELIDTIRQLATQTAMAGGAIDVTQPVLETPADQVMETPTTPTEPEAVTTPVPTATQAVVVDVPPITVPESYTLQGGEFPYCIARRFNVDPGELLRINGMSSTSIYYSGMTLKIPQSGRTFPGQRSLRNHPTTYTVRSGDTIYKIACYFGDVAPEQIAAANNLSTPYKLTPGQTLQIP